jgi:hypothetical protein
VAPTARSGHGVEGSEICHKSAHRRPVGGQSKHHPGFGTDALYIAAAADDIERLTTWFDADGRLRAEAMRERPSLSDVGWPPRPPLHDDPADVLAEALSLAAQLGRTRACEELLDRGADPARAPLYGITALHFAVSNEPPADHRAAHPARSAARRSRWPASRHPARMGDAQRDDRRRTARAPTRTQMRGMPVAQRPAGSEARSARESRPPSARPTGVIRTVTASARRRGEMLDTASRRKYAPGRCTPSNAPSVRERLRPDVSIPRQHVDLEAIHDSYCIVRA